MSFRVSSLHEHQVFSASRAEERVSALVRQPWRVTARHRLLYQAVTEHTGQSQAPVHAGRRRLSRYVARSALLKMTGTHESGLMANDTSESAGGPILSDFLSVSDFTKAHEAFHDARTPSDAQTLERAARLASNSIFAVRLQLTRIRASRTSDDVGDGAMQRWADSEFLVVALWRLRTTAFIAASVDSVRDAMIAAIDAFDQQLPHLQVMRHVSQHLDDYAIDHPTRRRQRKPGSTSLVGRRLLEVAGLGDDEFHWLRGKLSFSAAEAAANALYSAVRRARDSFLNVSG